MCTSLAGHAHMSQSCVIASVQLSLCTATNERTQPASLLRRTMNQAIFGASRTPGSAVTTRVVQTRIACRKLLVGRPSWLKQGSTQPRALLRYCRRCLPAVNILHGWKLSLRWQLKLARNPRCPTNASCALLRLVMPFFLWPLHQMQPTFSEVGVTQGAKSDQLCHHRLYASEKPYS